MHSGIMIQQTLNLHIQRTEIMMLQLQDQLPKLLKLLGSIPALQFKLILIFRRLDGTATILPLSPSQALLECAEETLLPLKWSQQRTLPSILQILRTISTMHLMTLFKIPTQQLPITRRQQLIV